MVLKPFHVKEGKKITGIWPRTPISKYVVMGPPRSKYLSYKCSLLNRYIQRLAKKNHDFSKIADLQARSAALGAAL